MAKVLKFSKHFVARWMQRTGGFPCIEEVNDIMKNSILVIKQEVLWRQTGRGAMVKHKELSHYWCHAAGVILLVDDHSGIAVTLITPDMASKYN